MDVAVTAREQARQLKQQHASWTNAMIARELGIPRNQVWAALNPPARKPVPTRVRWVGPRAVLTAPYDRFVQEHRACPLELMDAVNECPCGNMPTRRHPNPPCECWGPR